MSPTNIIQQEYESTHGWSKLRDSTNDSGTAKQGDVANECMSISTG
jgi:hypothetical protein